MGRYTNKKVNNTPKAKKLKKELEKLCKNKSIGGKTNNEKDL